MTDNTIQELEAKAYRIICQVNFLQQELARTEQAIAAERQKSEEVVTEKEESVN